MHTAAIDRYGPDLNRNVGRVEPQPGAPPFAQGCSVPVVCIDAKIAVALATKAALDPDPVGGFKQAAAAA